MGHRGQGKESGKWSTQMNEKFITSSLPWALILKTNSSIQDTNKNLKRTTFFFLTWNVLEPDFQGRNMGRFRESLHRRLHLSQNLQEIQSVTMLGFDGTALWWNKAKARDRGPGREMCPCVLGTPFPLAAQHRSAEEAPGTLSTANRWVSDIRSADPWALYSSISLGSLATEKVTISWRHPVICSGPLFPTMKSLHFRSPGCYTLLTILGCYSQLEKAVSQILNSKTEK